MIPEALYQRAFVTHLSAQGFQVHEEFSYALRRFDALAFDGCTIFGYEVKCRDFKKAVLQARYMALCCDSASIVVPQNAITDGLLNDAENYGVGIYTIGEPPNWLLSEIIKPVIGKPVHQHKSSLLRLAGWHA
jgi:hypothetical protein